MAHGASLVLCGLVMERRSGGSWRIHRQCMALKAEQVYIATLEQARVRRTMRRMAGHAAFRFHRRMLPCEWAGFVRVAVKAKHVLGRSGTQLFGQETAVRVVAVTA